MSLSNESATGAVSTRLDPTDDLNSDRRKLISWIPRLGMGMVGGLAGLFAATVDPAEAWAYSYLCCDLATTTPCCGGTMNSCCYPQSGGNSPCPGGTYKRYWYCSAGARIIGCGECTYNSSSCDFGPWVCSQYWDDGSC